MRHSFLLGAILGSTITVFGCDSQTFIALSPPLVIINVDRVDFGEIPIGFEVTKKVTLANGGELPLTIKSLAIEGAQVFGVASSVMRIEAGRDIDVSITFAPTAVLSYEATFDVETDASNGAIKSVPVAGVGIDPVSCGDCNQPPRPTCLTDDDLATYASTGMCVMGECQYTATVVACASGCDRSSNVCGGTPPADGGVTDLGTPDDAGVRDGGEDPRDAGARDAGVMAPNEVFDVPGEYTFVVPAGVTQILVRAWGGGGEGGNQNGATGGGAGFVQARVPVTPNETLDVWVAEGGGLASNLGYGGGASYLRRANADLIVAGGGGGGGSDGNSGNSMSGGRGGAGGGLVGENGQDGIGTIAAFCTAVTGGTGGAQSTGGVGGTPQGNAQYKCSGQPGTRDVGGRATGSMQCETTPGADRWHSGGGQANGGGGGGGAGYFGGGGAGFIWTYCAGGGGGGSSYAATTAVDVVHEMGAADVAGRQSESFGAGTGGARCRGNPNQCVGNEGGDGRVEIAY